MTPECDALRARAATIDPYSTAAVTALRRDFDKDLVFTALALAKARDKAKTKFGDRAATLVADPDGVEMASSTASASWKARRFAAHAAAMTAGGSRAALRVMDLCCGVGGDAMALRDAGLDVVAVDNDATRAWMAGLNARCESRCANVEDIVALRDPTGAPPALFHLDPARRTKNGSTSSRTWTLDDLQPGPAVIRDAIHAYLGGAVKLAPGIDYTQLAVHGLAGEVEIISENGRLTQAVLWTGALARATPSGTAARSATLLRGPAHTSATAFTISGEPDALGSVPVGEPAKYIFDVDDCVERAELLTVLSHQLNAPMLHPRLGLFTSDTLLESPFLTPFELFETAKWNQQRAAAALKRLGAGSVEVKTRAKAVNPDELQPTLTKDACVKGGVPLVLFVLRFGNEVRMLVAKRIPIIR